jgi:predicted transcriptional regulator
MAYSKHASAPDIEPALTEMERKARAASIAEARAEREAGETVSGKAVLEWLASWGKENEKPAPEPAPRRS